MLRASTPTCEMSQWRCARRGARDDVTRVHDVIDLVTDQNNKHDVMHCHTSCCSLSLKPQGRSCSFLVHRSIWLKFPHIQKIITLARTSWQWENFMVSMVTKWFPWKRTSPYFFRARPRPACRVWGPSARKRRSSFRTNPATDATQIIVRLLPDQDLCD